MEKRTPHSKLPVVKALVAAGYIRVTSSATRGAAQLGLDAHDIRAAVMALTSADFCKSMTTYADHAVWQDVYRPCIRVGRVYLKLAVVDDVLIVSFKEL